MKLLCKRSRTSLDWMISKKDYGQRNSQTIWTKETKKPKRPDSSIKEGIASELAWDCFCYTGRADCQKLL